METMIEFHVPIPLILTVLAGIALIVAALFGVAPVAPEIALPFLGP